MRMEKRSASIERQARAAYVSDQVRRAMALMIREERKKRGWSQARLAWEMEKSQALVSRLENPNYGRLTVESLLHVAAAFDLPLRIDFPSWDDWRRDIVTANEVRDALRTKSS